MNTVWSILLYKNTFSDLSTEQVVPGESTICTPLLKENGSPSESIHQTPTNTDSIETSQDSLELEDDNASTVSHLSELSGLSDLSREDWKPMPGSMVWVSI